MAPTKSQIRMDVDLGEAYGNYTCAPDEQLLPFIDYANVACGFHAGDPVAMQKTVRACKEQSVAVGAHPGFPDVQGFGRRQMNLTPEEHTASIIYQVGALQGFLDVEELPLSHVKPHGSLYNMSYRDEEIARAIYKGIKYFPTAKAFGLGGSWHERLALEMNIPFVSILNGDLNYDKQGHTIIEQKKNPWQRDKVLKHVHQQLFQSSVTAITGEVLPINLRDHDVSICCHSDSPGCVEIVQATREVVDSFNERFFPICDQDQADAALSLEARQFAI